MRGWLWFWAAHNLGRLSTQTVFIMIRCIYALQSSICNYKYTSIYIIIDASGAGLLSAAPLLLSPPRCCDGVAAHMSPLPDVFVLPHSFTGCHGHCLQGEQLTAAFVISYNTTCIPCTILRSISRQCRAERSTFALFLPRTKIRVGDSRRRLPTWRMLRRSWAFPCPVSSGFFNKEVFFFGLLGFFCVCVVFIFHFKLEQLSPMCRFGHYCRHVPGIGCNCQWKQPQPHHRPRWGAGEPPQGGED